MHQFLLPYIILYSMLSSSFCRDDHDNFKEMKNHIIMRRSADIDHSNILDFWTKHKKDMVLHEEIKESVLVMGNTGAGKSTLVLAILGRKLWVTIEDGYFKITDKQGKIGTGASSKTLIPEVMTDEDQNTTFIDCPGFRDNRDVEHEISSTYFRNILMNRVHKVKFVFVINYDSLKKTGNKNDFDDLFEHIYGFLKNVSKYHDGIALVATKVENIHAVSDDGKLVLMNTDEVILSGIDDFLRNKIEVYQNKKENPRKYLSFVNLINVLLEKENGSYKKIAILRQPIQAGLFQNMTKTKQNIDNIYKMIQCMRFIDKKEEDFGLSLSKSTRNTVNRIVDDIFNNALTNQLYEMCNETLTHYLQMEKQYSDIERISVQISLAYNYMNAIRKLHIDKPLPLFKALLDATNFLNISVSLTTLNIISDDIEKLKFFTTLLNDNTDIRIQSLKYKALRITDSIESMKCFYDFLNDLLVNLASYNSQKLKSDYRIKNIMTSSANSKYKVVKDIIDLENITTEIGIEKNYQKISTLKLNQFQLKHLRSIFEAFSKEIEITCPTLEQITVKGYNVKLSDVINKAKSWDKAKNIKIFALNKLFIDCSIDKTGAEAQLYIFAPYWEIIGAPKIILDGKEGAPHEKESAQAAKFSSENGRNGLPGLPGGPGGRFFGVGRDFLYSKFLEIHVNGGKGGPGQHGGSGADGIPGEELSEQFMKRVHDGVPGLGDPNDILTLGYKYTLTQGSKATHHVQGYSSSAVHGVICSAVIFGKPAIKPTDGGNGGDAGIGGQAGSIEIYGLGNTENVKKIQNTGSQGLVGKGGSGGKKTTEGRKLNLSYNCLKQMTSRGYDIHGWTDGAELAAGKDGQPGFSKSNPPTNIQLNTNILISEYKDFVRINLYNNIQENQLRSFINKLENNKEIKTKYDTVAFVNELQGLENQFLELRNKIDLVPFYETLLTRVEDFASTQNIFEIKKVLSYVYTAALTKLFTLKKKRKGKTVVNLYQYLNTIETNVKDVRDTQHLQIVEHYQNDYKSSLYKKIREANDLIQNKIEPEINQLWEESDRQIQSIFSEIQQNKNNTKDAITSLHKDRNKVYNVMAMRGILLPLKLASSALSFIGPIGAMAGAAVTASTSIAEGMLVDTTSGLGQNKIYSLDPNLKLMSRVTEVLNNKPQTISEKLKEVVTNLDKYNDEISITQKEKIELSEKIGDLKTKLMEVEDRQVKSISQMDRRQEDAKRIEKELNDFISTRKEIIEDEKKKIEDLKTEKDDAEKIRKELKLEKSLRRINDAQSILSGVEILFSYTKRIANDEGMIGNINKQISQYVHELKSLEKLESQVYETIIPDLRRIEETVNEMKTSVNGSSHAKLDYSKWTVRKTLSDVKLLLQKFTHKMSIEIQSDTKRCIEKIDEGFSILIDIYDRIDSYSDSVRQAEYIAHIVSPPMTKIEVTDSKLRHALICLKNIIQSNILFEKYGIALHAFKQHYFPFAAHVLQKFQLPLKLELDDTIMLRSSIVEKIRDMKNHIDETQATISEYSKYTHEDNIFNSNTTGSSPFYVWKYDTIKAELHKLLNGSEILLKADISKGLNYNSVKYTDIGINFKLTDVNEQNNLNVVLKEFELTMTMVGNNYYRCGERYYYLSFDDDITLSYTLNKDETKNWINPNSVYTGIRKSHAFLSPYGLWSVKLKNVTDLVTFDVFQPFANKTIDLELVGRGDCIEEAAEFNFDICNEYLDTFYNVENIAKEL